MKLMEVSTQGPVCKFGDAHLYYTLHILDEEGPISRNNLANKLGIGEGSVRNIISILREWGLITVSRAGISLSTSGKDFLRDTPLCLVTTPVTDSIPGDFQQGIIVRGMAGQITNGMDQRDNAVIAGANGASVYYLEDDSLMVTNLWDKVRCETELSRKILDSADISEDDVLLITSANRPEVAAVSAIAAGLAMI